MQKSIEEMSDHEMLVELLQEKRRAETLRYVKIAVYAADSERDGQRSRYRGRDRRVGPCAKRQ